MVYFPASGYRSRDMGTLYFVVTEGSVWSASTFGYLGLRANGFLLDGQRLEVLSSLTRGISRPVRCVQVFINDTFFYFCSRYKMLIGSVTSKIACNSVIGKFKQSAD